MPNMTLTKTPMPEQAPDVRNKNFKEVSLGYTEEMAVEEAGRCLHCKNPKCVEGCPVNIRIPEFIAKVSERDFLGAYEVITSTNALPALSGRVCPQESQCESKCVRGVKGEPVAIGRLERFVADWYRENVNKMPEKPESNGIKVAVVGSGPSGLTCASELAKKGYEVSIFEALHTAGGVLVYGIPEFRLPKAIVANEVKKLEAMGVHVMTDMVIGKVLSIDELFEEMGFKAVFVGSGAGLPMFMHIEGEALKYQPHEGLSRRERHAGHPFERRCGRRRRQRCHGCRALRETFGACVHRLSPRRGGNARPSGRAASCQGRGHRAARPVQPDEDP